MESIIDSCFRNHCTSTFNEMIIASAEQLADIPNSSSNNVSNLNNALENDIKTQDKAIGINPLNSTAWKNKGLVLDNLNKSDEVIKAYDKAIEIDSQNLKA